MYFLSGAGLIACKDVGLFEAFSCPWPPSPTFYKLLCATRWLKGGKTSRQAARPNGLVTPFPCGCKPRPSGAEVTACPPPPRLVLNGLQRGETARSGSLTRTAR